MVEELVKAAKLVVGMEKEAPISSEDIWVHVVSTLNPEHVSVVWSAHDIPGKNRTEAWVTRVCENLAEKIRRTLVAYGPDEAFWNIKVCVDGVLFPHDTLTGYSERQGH